MLDWRPIYKEIKSFVLPTESGLTHSPNMSHSMKTLTKVSVFAQLYFDPCEVPAMLKEFLPHYSTSFSEGAFVVVGLINLLLPTAPGPDDRDDLLPQNYLPTFFHLWSLVGRSKTFDMTFLDFFSRLARDNLPAKHVPFSEHGIFTEEQSSLIFTAILRLLEIPVGQSTSPYSALVDISSGLGILLDRDPRKHSAAHHIARLVVMSLSPACLESQNSILSQLEGLIQAVETFFHPSNHGSWTKTLAQLVYYLADFFVMRWNKEQSAEMDVAPYRRLTEPLKRRFVMCLRDVIFMGIYAKSSVAVSFSLSTLQRLSYLQPDLILPGALQRIYPSLQGLVEVHRTDSSLRALQTLSRTIARTKGYRCHLTTLLGLALPGVDANDLEKSMYTLSFIQAVSYCIPIVDLSKGREDLNCNMLLLQWIGGEMEKMEAEGAGVQLNYETELSDEMEDSILRSSTCGFGEFIGSLLGRVFTLLENLPDPSRVRTGSPEENIVNTLPATFLPFFASLSPEYYDMALSKIVNFVSNHVVHQARDAMAYLCNAICKVNPEKALKRFIPVLIQSIRTEIDDNGAGSSRTTGSDILPRDRALVWYISILSMCVVHVGNEVLSYRKELFEISVFMQSKCKGIPTVHISNFIHHLLLNLIGTYTSDYSLFEPDVIARGIQPSDWSYRPEPQNLTPKWHVPSREELEFAVEIFKDQASSSLDQLVALTSGTSSVKRDGIGKDWSDEVTRKLILLRLLFSGTSMLFDPKRASKTEGEIPDETNAAGDPADAKDFLPDSGKEDADADVELDTSDETETRQSFSYAAGRLLQDSDPLYITIHQIREEAGRVLHDVHRFLTDKQEDDVTCFAALYSAYKAWFVDVGIERSAHVLDRVIRLYKADSYPYEVKGLRKDYPRPLLVRRATIYHLQRLKENAGVRPCSRLDEVLLLDIAESCVSIYTETRRHAQGAGESALRVIYGGRVLMIPPLLKALQKGVKENDYARIKGAVFSLLLSTIGRTVGRHWKYAPTLIRTYLEASAVDRPSVQRICSAAMIEVVDFGRSMGRMAILDRDIVEAIAPTKDVGEAIAEKNKKIKHKRVVIEKKKSLLTDELVSLARVSHWKIASRASTIVSSMGMRFEHITSENLAELVTLGAIDDHPGLRAMYSQGLIALFTLIDVRALSGHKYENYVAGREEHASQVDLPTKRYETGWTDEYLSSFAHEQTDYFVDNDFPGWLVWSETLPANKSRVQRDVLYDEVELNMRKYIGKLFTRQWFSKYFMYIKQEPRDPTADKFRMSHTLLLTDVFEVMLRDGFAAATFEEIKEEIAAVFEDGSDKHQHRATAEILGALMNIGCDDRDEMSTMIWEYAFPFVQRIFTDGLTPENLGYWTTFLHMLTQCRDPRRAWPMVKWLSDFRLDMTTNAAFKESSKINMLHQCIIDAGWRFQLEKPIMENFLGHLDHPYKGVREAMGQTIATIFRTRYHESYPDVKKLLAAQMGFSSVGEPPYMPSKEFDGILRSVFSQLETWRHERRPGQNTPTPYTSGSKTVLLWLDSTLSSHECAQLVSFFADVFTPQLLHMMDVKEDPELQSLAYHVFRHLPNIPYAAEERSDFVSSLIHIGRNSPSWHQRLRVMINIQIVYFRRLFLMSAADRSRLFDCIASMLQDTQSEVRAGASTTLSGMIRCSPVSLRNEVVGKYEKRFIKILKENPFPKKPKNRSTALARSETGTPTPEHNQLIILRHGAVLGLGALIEAFPYASPPPTWMADALTTISVLAANDPGVVGPSAKSIISEFKKTRQDTWHIDAKVSWPYVELSCPQCNEAD